MIQDEALAKELAAEFYYARGREKVSNDYMREAYYAYMKWNSQLKIQAVDKKLSTASHSSGGSLSWESRDSPTTSTNSSPQASLSSTFTATISGSSSELLDLTTVIKASQALLGKKLLFPNGIMNINNQYTKKTGEIELSKLVEKLIQNLMENTGADKCVLLLRKKEGLQVNALATIGSSPLSISMDLAIPIEESDCCPVFVVNYVSMSGDILVQDDPAFTGSLSHFYRCLFSSHLGVLLFP